jgi:hypothetical protein
MSDTNLRFLLARTTSKTLRRAGIQSPGPLSSQPGLTGLLVAVLLVCSAGIACAEDDIVLGHNAAGQLKVQVGFDEPLGLPVSVFPGIPGYATGAMGFHSAALDQPSNDFFQVSPAADFRFILLTNDPGMEVWNDHGSGYMTNGESFYVGVAPFDTHPVWNLLGGRPGDWSSLTLRFRDLNGIYLDSDPFVLSFTPIPPVLMIFPAAPGFVTLSWAPTAPGLVLQMSPSLTPAAWTNAPSGTNNPATVPVSSPTRFYRVSK